MKRTSELRREIRVLTERIGHLTARACDVEAGTDEWTVKMREGKEVERTESHKVQHSEAVAYWREVRENEKRRDELRAELRALEAAAVGEPLDVHITFDGGPAPEPPAPGGQAGPGSQGLADSDGGQ